MTAKVSYRWPPLSQRSGMLEPVAHYLLIFVSVYLPLGEVNVEVGCSPLSEYLMAFADRNCNHCIERRHQACKSRLHQMPTQQLDTAPGTSLKFLTQYQRWIRLSMRAPLQQSEHSTEKNKIKMQEHPAPRIDLDFNLESKRRHVQRVCAWTRKVRSPHGKA